MEFQLESDYKPRGDQPQAIDALTRSLEAGNKFQTLLGVTGSGKTFTVANVIERLQRPTLVISHNKTLAAQLYSEFKQFFPRNAVEYFVSYFDYYQPEAYIPSTDTYIEKDSARNDEIERLRLAATSALLSRRDVIVVASVSCIYGLGSPEDYYEMMAIVRRGDEITRESLLAKLVDMQYERNDIAFSRSHFRVRGDVVEVRPSYTEDALRIEFFGDRVEKITRFEPLTGHTADRMDFVAIYPAKHFVTPSHKLPNAIQGILAELDERVAWFEKQGKLVEAQRLRQRTMYDIEMLQEMGFCTGIENYSRHLSGRAPGSRPFTLLDFFEHDQSCSSSSPSSKRDWLLIIDESHASVPQIGGMYNGDRARKTTLVDYGFRLPSALDNRPLNFAEFESLIPQVIFTSATPAAFEREKSGKNIVEQIIRPTGLIDPLATVKPLKGQIDDLIEECRKRTERKERVLVTTLTKRTAEDLTDYLRDVGLRVQYLHSEINAIERVEILRDLRAGNFDVLVGINLLREGLDLPEVSLVAILDADKEGFLRSTTSLIQTAGRAARHLNASVILYADTLTDSIRNFLALADYRRQRQLEYNKQHKITPKSVVRAVQESLRSEEGARELEANIIRETGGNYDVNTVLRELEAEMLAAAEKLEFEKAALLRDQINELKAGTSTEHSNPKKKITSYRRSLEKTK